METPANADTSMLRDDAAAQPMDLNAPRPTGPGRLRRVSARATQPLTRAPAIAAGITRSRCASAIVAGLPVPRASTSQVTPTIPITIPTTI